MREQNVLSGIFALLMGIVYLILAIIDGAGRIAIVIARNWPRNR